MRQPGAEPALTLGARLYLAGQVSNLPPEDRHVVAVVDPGTKRSSTRFFLFAVMLGACPTGVVFVFVTLAIEAPKIPRALCRLSFADFRLLRFPCCFFYCAWLVRNWTKLPFGGCRSVFMCPCRTHPRERPSSPGFSPSTRPTLRGETLV